jgi:molybdopterin-guanine dinucleotide biosynthesis protein A
MFLFQCDLAEGVGFEPTIRFPVYTLSKRAPSATRPPLRSGEARNIARRFCQTTRSGVAVIDPSGRPAAGAHPPTLGVILAGGRARRMGFADKPRIRIGGTTILDRVIARLGPQCRELVLNANDDVARFADTKVAIAADSVPGYAGPLAGILAGLDWAAEHAPDIAWMVSVPGDCPFLPRDLVERLHLARNEGNVALACACSGARRHPAVGLWPVNLREDLRRALTHEGIRKVDEWSGRYPRGIAAWQSDPVDPFFNVNTPAEAAEAEQLAAQYPDI